MKQNKLKLMNFKAIPLLLLLFAINCFASAPQDSIKTGSFQIEELKQIAKLLNEVEFRRTESSLKNQKMDRLNEIVSDQSKIIESQKQVNRNLKDQIELTKPAFYDNFVFGAASTAIVFVALILFTK